jgi:hypothetical protein
VEGTNLITAARTSGHGVICCLKKLLAGTNKHYCMNTDNVGDTTQRCSVGLADRQRHCAIA